MNDLLQAASSNEPASASEQRVRSLVLENKALRAKAAATSRHRFTGVEAKSPSIWHSMFATSAGSYQNWAGISAGSDSLGVIAYGPYSSLSAGAYELEIVARVLPTKSAVSEVAGVLEILYNDVFVARLPFLSSAHGSSYYHFVVGEHVAALLDEARYEFRFVSTGGYALQFYDFILKTVDRKGAHRNEICLTDWISLGSTAIPRPSNMMPIEAQLGDPGCVFYGPYASLVPDSYEMMVEIDTGLRPSPVKHAVVADVTSEGHTLAASRVDLSTGKQLITLPFTVEMPDSKDLVSRPLEFRLTRLTGQSLRVNSIKCHSL